MAHKLNPPLANAGATSTTFSCQIEIPNKHLPDIRNVVEGDSNDAAKVASLAQGVLLDLCEGGMMVNQQAVRRMTEAAGSKPTVDDLVEQFQKGVGRVNGRLEFTVSITPEQEPMLQQIADFQGLTIPKVVQDHFDYEFDQGNMYDYRPYLSRVLMLNADKEALVKLLGKDFSSGTELSELVKKHIAEHASPFEEVEK